MNADRLLQRFLRYVQIDTTAREESDQYPSSEGQRALGALVVGELLRMGLGDARQDGFGVVTATLRSTGSGEPLAVAYCAHLDTSPETSGANVRPQVIRDYPGGDLVLPGDPSRVIRASDCPELAGMVGKTLITSDGTTLLGADDKAGVAVILEAVHWLAEHPEIGHAPVRVVLTCDEEVGRGVDHLDAAALGVVACYTLDGQGADTIDVETFSADLAVVTLRGVNIHPSIAKDRMVNAVRAAADFLARLPHDTLSPETTQDRQGFLHPYELAGGVGEVRLRILLRDFDAEALTGQAELLRRVAAATTERFPGLSVDVTVTPQYRNMAAGLAKEPRAVGFAEEALRRLGRTARRTVIRGGTDGSRLTAMGLPTPNLSCGQHTPHSATEWACLEEMVQSAEWLVSLARVWGEA